MLYSIVCGAGSVHEVEEFLSVTVLQSCFHGYILSTMIADADYLYSSWAIVGLTDNLVTAEDGVFLDCPFILTEASQFQSIFLITGSLLFSVWFT